MAPPRKKSSSESPVFGVIKEKETKPKKPSEEFGTFAGDPNFQKLLYDLDTEKLHLEKQKRILRWVACSAALIIVGLLVTLEWVIIEDIDFSSTDPGYLIFISISPIIAVTAIVVSILVSAFRVKVDSVGDTSKKAQIINSASSGLGQG